MIEVDVHKDGIDITGHAGYAPVGEDIVCASISTLVQTLIASIEDLTEDQIKYDLDPGRTSIKYGNLSDHGSVLVDSFFVGVSMIADEYPDNVRIV